MSLLQLIEQQKYARDMSYKACFPTAIEYIIERTGSAVGAIYLAANTQQQNVHIVDIGFSEKNRSKGYGSEVINQLNPPPDNVLLLVDSLPTTDQLEPARGMVTGAERLRFHYDAIDVIPSGVPINVLLYPMEGDYQASIAYWLLAYGTGGSYMSISKDWP